MVALPSDADVGSSLSVDHRNRNVRRMVLCDRDCANDVRDSTARERA